VRAPRSTSSRLAWYNRGPTHSVVMLSAVVVWYFRPYSIGKVSAKVLPKLAISQSA
jgi:hypothetical protein